MPRAKPKLTESKIIWKRLFDYKLKSGMKFRIITACKILGITRNQYQSLRTDIDKRLAQMMTDFKNENPTTKYIIDEHFLERLTTYKSAGFSDRKCAKLFDMPQSSFMNLKRGDNRIKRICENQIDEDIATAVGSLKKLMKGFKIKKTYHANYLGNISSEQYEEEVLPNLRAINSFLLNHKDGWVLSDKQNMGDEKDRGSIIEAISKETGNVDETESEEEDL